MATNNKFIVERTNVLAADVTLGVSYAALDDGDFGFYGKAGETYEFDARVVYSAAADTDGAAFSVTAGAPPTTINTPDHGTASVPLATGLNQAFLHGVITPSADGFVGISGIAENASTIIAKGGISTMNWKRIFVGDNE